MNDQAKIVSLGERRAVTQLTQLAHHPASAIFRMLEGAEFDAFAQNIKTAGLKFPIFLHPDGSILDGRNRYKACIERGVEPRFETWDAVGNAADFVWNANFMRRQLTEGAKQIAAARYAQELESEAKKRGHANLIPGAHKGPPVGSNEPTGVTGRSREKAAEKFGVHSGSVKRALVVVKDGTPEEIKSVETGETAVSTVAMRIRERKRAMAPVPTQRPAPVAETADPAGARMSVPDGRTMEDIANEVLRRHEDGASLVDIAKEMGIGVASAAQMEEVVMIAARTDLPPHETILARRAVASMNERKRVAKSAELLEPIANRLWGPKSERKGSRKSIEAARWRRFETAYGTIIGACQPAAEIPVPHISEERANAMVKDLKKAAASVNALREKIMRMWK